MAFWKFSTEATFCFIICLLLVAYNSFAVTVKCNVSVETFSC